MKNIKQIFLIFVFIFVLSGAGCQGGKSKKVSLPLYSPPTTTESISKYKPLSYTDIYKVSGAATISELQGESDSGDASSPTDASSGNKPSKKKDLWKIYKQLPTANEINWVVNDFNIKWVDDEKTKEKWPSNYFFGQQSTLPNKLVAAAKLNILRQQEFSESLPFSNEKSFYDYVLKNSNRLELRLDCDYSISGNGVISMNRQFSVWDWRDDIIGDTYLKCKQVSTTPVLAPYVYSLQDLVHKARHNEAGDPGHVRCGSDQYDDPYLENGGGNAYAAMYLMWVYKYGIHDPNYIKQEAKKVATLILAEKFCQTPKHSNPKIQAIVNELLNIKKK